MINANTQVHLIILKPPDGGFYVIENLHLWFWGNSHCFCLSEPFLLRLFCCVVFLSLPSNPCVPLGSVLSPFTLEFRPDYPIYLDISTIFHLLVSSLNESSRPLLVNIHKENHWEHVLKMYIFTQE